MASAIVVGNGGVAEVRATTVKATISTTPARARYWRGQLGEDLFVGTAAEYADWLETHPPGAHAWYELSSSTGEFLDLHIDGGSA